ncbi:cytochrome b [Fontimonas thermophila]|nr:cytochrome b [Fontimonas thermophila]
MDRRPELARYGALAQLGHWLTVLLLVGVFGLGFYMVDLPLSPARVKLFAYHKWIGVTVFAVAVLRLIWRAVSPPPPLPDTLRPWERQLAALTHRLLYLLVLAVPLSGWLMSSAKGFQTVWLGVLPIPDLLDKNPALGAALQRVHFALNKLLLAVVVLHVGAALKHHFIDRDTVLLRMLPRAMIQTRHRGKA